MPHRLAAQELAWYKHALDESAIVAVTDVRGRILHVNERFCIVSGYDESELIGKDHRVINSGYHTPEFFRGLWRAIAHGQVWRGEIRNRRKDGKYYWVDTTIVPLLKEDGKPEKYIAIRYDITERKRVETQLRAHESMVQLGQMAAVIAHEVRNPLAGISGAIQVIAQRLSPEGPEVRILKEVIARVASLNEVLTGLLDFSRPCEPQMRACRAGEVVEKAAMFMRDNPSYQHVELRISGPDFRIVADPELLGRALLNLVINAAQACEDVHPEGRGGIIEIGLAASGDTGIDISVSDNGPGLSPEVAASLFKPFFTTKIKGTGLGLAVVKQLIECHGGTVHVASSLSGGASFVMHLPVEHQALDGGRP